MNDLPFYKFNDIINNEDFKFSISRSIEDISKEIKLLEDQLNKKEADFYILEDICFNLISILPIPVFNYSESFILRARPNYNGEIFTRTSQLSYNPTQSEIELGRFNLKGEPVFYGAIPIASKENHGALTAITESYKDLFNKQADFRFIYLTIGRWQVDKPIPLIVLTFWEKLNHSFHIKNLNPAFIEQLSKVFSKEDKKKCELLYNYISEKAGRFSDTTNNYLLTTAFYHAIRRKYGNKVGILYSSVMTENKGLNVALSKEIVDEKFIHLDFVVMYKCLRNPSNSKAYNIIPCSKSASIDYNGEFKILGIT